MNATDPGASSDFDSSEISLTDVGDSELTSNSKQDRSDSNASDLQQVQVNILARSDAIGKLKTLLEQLSIKEQDVRKLETEHLHKAQRLLGEMNKTAAFNEFKQSKLYKEQGEKLSDAMDAAKRQLRVLERQNGTVSDDDSSTSADSYSEDEEVRELHAKRKSTYSPSLLSPSPSASNITIDKEEEQLLSALSKERSEAKKSATSILNASGSKAVDMRDLDAMLSTSSPNTSHTRLTNKERHRQQTAAAGRKLIEENVSDEEDSDNDLENYIRRWRRSRDEDIVGVLKALRKENKLLKKKLKKERLRIGIELRRVNAANRVLEDQNKAMQELLLRAKQEIQNARNGNLGASK